MSSVGGDAIRLAEVSMAGGGGTTSISGSCSGRASLTLLLHPLSFPFPRFHDWQVPEMDAQRMRRPPEFPWQSKQANWIEL